MFNLAAFHAINIFYAMSFSSANEYFRGYGLICNRNYVFCFTFITFNCFSGEIIGCQHDGSTRAFPVNVGNGNRNRCTTVWTFEFFPSSSIIHSQVLSTWTYEINICVFHLSLHGLRMEMMQQCPPSRRYFNADILTRQARKHKLREITVKSRMT